MSSWTAAQKLFDEVSIQRASEETAEMGPEKPARNIMRFQALSSAIETGSPYQPQLPFDDSTLAKQPSAVPSAQHRREIARAITRKIPKEAWESLFEERNRLLDKEDQSGLSRKEQARLRLVEWQLDNLEDATIGPRLDDLEVIADAYEDLAAEIQRYAAELSRMKNRSYDPNRRGGRGRNSSRRK